MWVVQVKTVPYVFEINFFYQSPEYRFCTLGLFGSGNETKTLIGQRTAVM